MQLFSKTPIAGKVKTRLTPALPVELAVEVAWCLTHKAMATAMAFDPRTELWLDGDSGFARNSSWSGSIHTQGVGDLGGRMAAAANRSLAANFAPIIIGSDCPLLDVGHLHRASCLLRNHEVVLGPALDGGYVLIGLCRPVPELFQDMIWSVPTVLNETRRRLRASGVRWAELLPLPDLDNVADLRALLSHPAAFEIFPEDLRCNCLTSLSRYACADRPWDSVAGT